MKKRVYLVKTINGEMQIFTLNDEHEQTLFELEYAETIIEKGDSIQDVVLKFSERIKSGDINADGEDLKPF